MKNHLVLAKCLLLIAVGMGAALPGGAQVFTNINASFNTNLGGFFLSSAVAADFDADGKMDFLIAGETGSGGFDPVWINVGSNVFSLAVDLNGDGRGAYQGTSAGAD